MSIPSEIPFTAFLQYSPRGQSQPSLQSKAFTRAVKNDSVFGPIRAIAYSARRLREELFRYPSLQACFSKDAILVPVPRSAPLLPGALWPARNFCDALQQEGVGGLIHELLIRHTAVPKSATAAAGQRPTVDQHYNSIAVSPNRPLLAPQQRLFIVDDVITRGATLLACYARLSEAYPDLPISVFALIRTMSGGDILKMLSPVAGTIALRNNQVFRNP